jgi:hypothetical protein
MKEYHVTVMSEDRYPDGSNSEDPHQKYGLTIQADTKEQAKQKALDYFRQEGKPVFWIQVH